ncbi:MAG: Crp/Fnr family transcriptional regulator [Firmicutes bacterium HGW-Firmicutes-7]|nr:MAG: Crp/Fnr family transcriptional regulator [Firmicutes bacterium HGW-Firmicutes-7]
MLKNKELSFIKSHLDFWDQLNPNEKNTIENNITKMNYTKGYNLHSADSECLGVLLVLNGELRVYILSEDGREVTLFRLNAGDTCVLSASCVLNTITFDVHIDAEMETEAYVLNIGAFSTLANQNIYVENFALKKTVERFSDVMWALEQILFMRFDKRLAVFLLDEMSKTNSTIINLTQEQIAKYIGSAREVVSRMLKVFQSQGILEQSRSLIRITDKEKLKKLL